MPNNNHQNPPSTSNSKFSFISGSVDNGMTLRWLAENCPPLDVHTQFTYWVMSKYFSASSFIAKIDNDYAGYIMSLYNEKDFFIWQIGILEDFRDMGLSHQLINQVVGLALNKGYHSIQVTIADANKSSYNAFAKYAKVYGYSINKIDYIEVKDASNPEFLEREAMYEIVIN